jgi:hypothetical protein
MYGVISIIKRKKYRIKHDLLYYISGLKLWGPIHSLFHLIGIDALDNVSLLKHEL